MQSSCVCSRRFFISLLRVFFLFRTASFSWNWEHFQARKSVFNLRFSLAVEKPHIKFVLVVHRILVGLDYYILLRIYFGWINTFVYGFLILPLPADFSSLNNRHKYFFSRGRLEFTPISIVLSLSPLLWVFGFIKMPRRKWKWKFCKQMKNS